MKHEDQIEFYSCPLCGRGTGNDVDGSEEHECEEEKLIKNEFATKIIHEKGRRFIGTKLPQELGRGKIGDCFDYCIVLAMHFPAYKYVEGIAKVPNKKEWIHHAWLTDEQSVVAYDPTWYAKNEVGEDVGTHMIHYIGVVMDTKKVVDFMLATKYKAVLENYWRAPELANKIFE